MLLRVEADDTPDKSSRCEICEGSPSWMESTHNMDGARRKWTPDTTTAAISSKDHAPRKATMFIVYKLRLNVEAKTDQKKGWSSVRGKLNIGRL